MDETKRIEGPELVHPKKFAPRPTYEHRAIFDRADDDLDDELRIGALPVDRLFDLREAFEGFVDQGSYIGVQRCAREVPPRRFRTASAIAIDRDAKSRLLSFRTITFHTLLSPPRCAYLFSCVPIATCYFSTNNDWEGTQGPSCELSGDSLLRLLLGNSKV